MRDKLIGLLACVAILVFPCVGVSDSGNAESNQAKEEKKLAEEEKRIEELRHCLSIGDSWQKCVDTTFSTDDENHKRFSYGATAMGERSEERFWNLGRLWVN